jgi:hypothetical protein
MAAAADGNAELVRLLLERGADGISWVGQHLRSQLPGGRWRSADF